MSTNSNKLAGKVAVVTGASKGIGAAIAKQLAMEGAKVIVNYSSSKKDADKVVDEIAKDGGKAIAVQANNVLGLILASQAAVRLFDAAGGNIVNISSIASIKGFPDGAIYSGTKGAVDAITRSLAAELGPRKIRVNAIRPGMVETEGTHSAGIAESEMRKQVEAQTPLGRIGQPRDIAGAVVFLASSDSSWITGETFVISGGYR